MIKYAKITASGQRFILRVTRETPRFVIGIEVNADGEEVVPPGYHNRMRVVQRTTITRYVEMCMNNKYGTLETVKP